MRRTGWTAVLLVDLTVALAWVEGNTAATTASIGNPDRGALAK